MVQRWEKLESETISDHRIFRIRRDRSRSPRTGEMFDFFVLETGDWINVIPITDAGKVVLIHQYRHGTGAVTLEIPGGMADDGDASLAMSALRELREETGYEAEQIIPIGVVEPNPAFLTNRCHTFLAQGARRVGPPQFDGAEDIQTEEIGLERIPSLIRDGRITHALVVAAFYHLERHREQHVDGKTNS
jgi:ADP-ribose pyrophosphatase